MKSFVPPGIVLVTIISFVHIAGLSAQEPDPEITPPPDSEPLSTPPPESEPLSTPPPERLDLHMQGLDPLPVPTPDPEQLVAPPPPPDIGIIDELLDTEPPPPEPEPEFAPPLEPGPEIPPPPEAPLLGLSTSAPDPAEFQRAIPRVEVWRIGSITPQVPASFEGRFADALMADTGPVTLVLEFDPVLEGKSVELTPPPGMSFQPEQNPLVIGANGISVLQLQLDQDFYRGKITCYAEGMTSVLPVSRASVEKVIAAEQASTGGGQ